MSKTAAFTMSRSILYCTAVITLTMTLSLVLQSVLHTCCCSASDTGCTVVKGKQTQLQPGSCKPWYSPHRWITPSDPVGTHEKQQDMAQHIFTWDVVQLRQGVMHHESLQETTDSPDSLIEIQMAEVVRYTQLIWAHRFTWDSQKASPKPTKPKPLLNFSQSVQKHSLPLAECYLRKNVSVKVRLDFMAVPCVVWNIWWYILFKCLEKINVGQ